MIFFLQSREDFKYSMIIFLKSKSLLYSKSHLMGVLNWIP